MRSLRIAAGAELATLVLLLVNLATVHWPAVSSALGPTHGCAYLFVIVLTVRQSQEARTRATALVPGVGGLLVLRRVSRVAAWTAASTTPSASAPRPAR